MIRLSKQQVERKIEFIGSYVNASNAADASKFDANANVSSKNIATLEAELWKDYNIQINRGIVSAKITELFGQELADEYNRQIEDHEIYVHDETSLKNYCCSITMYPFLIDGLTKLGGESKAPKHIDSFCGSFVNLIFAVSSQFAGACLHKDQRLLISESGYTYAPKIKDLVSDYVLDRTFSNWQGDWEYSHVSGVKVWEHGKYVDIKKVYRRKYASDIYTVTTASGKRVKCSSDHVFKVLFRDRYIEVKASDLRVYDTVVNTMNEFGVDTSSDDFIKGQLIGIIAGDGSITGNDSIRVSINYNEKFIADFLDSVFIKFCGRPGKLADGNRCYSYSFNSREYLSEIKGYFDTDDYHSYNKKIDVTRYSLEFLLGYLDGLMVTDGGWNNSHHLSVTSDGIVNNVRDILEMLGIYRDIKVTPTHDNKKELYSIMFSNRLNKYMPLTVLRRAGNVKFKNTNADEIPYYGQHTHKHSIGMASGYRAFSRSKRTSDCTYDAIISIDIEKNDDEYVYEIETETNWYSAGGILTHNCATVEFLLYFDHFARRDYGDDYLSTNRDKIANHLQHVVYAINQPAAARGYQSVFWNISLFDEHYFNSMFGDFVFPDENFTKPDWKSVSKLQTFFMEWFNKERTKAVLTFPVVTAAMLTENGKVKDREFLDMCAGEMSEGNSFFTYLSDSADSLASCCRLRNELADNTFSYSLGAGGVSTGSINVITLNMNRLIQEKIDLKTTIEKIHKYQVAYRRVMEQYLEHHMLTVYDAGFISMDKQFLTIGINGMVEGAEALGFTISNNPEYIEFVSSQLKVIYDANKEAYKTYGYKFNTEFVPAENLGVKNAAWDRKRGLKVPRDCYNSYFYVVEDTDSNPLDKIILHGKEMVKYLDGGSALHLNLEEYLTKDAYVKLFDSCALAGCNYFTTNVKVTICNDCENIDKHTLKACPKCGSQNIDYATRIIGYLKRVGSFSSARQKEESQRYYAID